MVMRPATAATIALLAGLAAAPAPAGANAKPPDDNACVFFRTVNDWQPLDDRHLVIWAPDRHDAYEVELAMPLTELRYAETLKFVDHNRDGQLCGFGMDKIVMKGNLVPTESSIVGMRRLDDAQLAALAAQYNVHIRGVNTTPQSGTPVREHGGAGEH